MDAEKTGIACSLLSALGYTICNCFLLAVADCDPAWVSAVKAFLTVLMFAPYLVVVARRGERLIAGWRPIVLLCISGAIANFGGNMCFQWSLRYIGMAFAIPICLGAIITTASILSRVWLKEALSPHIVQSIAVLILAIIVLNIGTWFADSDVAVSEVAVSDLAVPDVATAATDLDESPGHAEAEGFWDVAFGGFLASLAGCSYATLSVTLRYFMRDRVPLATPMVIVGTIGFVGLGLLGIYNIGFEGIMATERSDFAMMILAGVANALAFLALTRALQLVSVSTVNIVNASQVAMGAVLGVVIFGEQLTWFLVAGCLLTMLGFMIRGRGARREARTIASQ